MNGKEYNIVTMCDSNIAVGNRLNDFTTPLPTVLEFPEPYSMAVTDVTFPNHMHNINNDDNTIGFGFYRNGEDLNPSMEIIATSKGGDLSRLVHMLKIPVKSRFYKDIDDFAESCLSFVENRKESYMLEYRKSALLQFEMEYKLACIRLNNISESDSETMMKMNYEAYRSNVLSNINAVIFAKYGDDGVRTRGIGPWGELHTNWVTGISVVQFRELVTDAVDMCPIWGSKEDYGFIRPVCREIWDATEGMITTQFSQKNLPALANKVGMVRYGHIVRICGYMTKLFKTLAADKNIKELLKLSLQFYMCGIAFVDICHELEEKAVYKDLTDEFLASLEAFYKKNELSVLPTDWSTHEKTYCQEAVDLFHDLTFSLYTTDDLHGSSIERILEGVFARVEIYFADVGRMLNYAKSHTGGGTDASEYMRDMFQQQEAGFVYLNPYFRIEKNKNKSDMYDSAVTQIRHLFKRMHYRDKKFVIDHVGYKQKKRTTDADYSEIIFGGAELGTFFGVMGGGVPLLGKNEDFIGDIEPNIFHKNTNLFLYCEQISQQFVNNKMTNLIAVIPVPWEGKYGDPIHVAFNTPHFLKLASNRLEMLRFKITNRFGEPIKFEDSSLTVLIISVLRPTRFHVI